MKKLRTLLLAIFSLTCLSAAAQMRHSEELSLAKMEVAMKTDERLIVLQFSTDWCVYCKMQERQLNKNKEIDDLLKEKTYYLRLDAESKDTITFNQTQYHPSPYENGLHDFTFALSGRHEQPSFPMWVILNKDQEILYRHNGLVKPKDLAAVLKVLVQLAVSIEQ